MGVGERGHRVVARRKRRVISQGMMQPVAKQPAAHAGRAVVQHRKERRRRLAAQGLGELEVPARRGVHAQVFADALRDDGDDVRERLSLGLPRVLEQGAAGGDRRLHVLAAVAGEAGRAELSEQNFLPGIEIEVPLGQPGYREPVRNRAFGREDFRRTDAAQLVLQQMRRNLGDAQVAAREVEPREAHRALGLRQGEQDVIGFFVEQLRVGQRPRGDDPRDLAVDRTLGSRRIADLLADRHRLAEAHQLGEVLVHRVIRHARHLDRRARRCAARGEREIEQPRGALRVVVEHLVEVAHAVEQQDVRVLRLQAQVLLHHGRGTGKIGRGRLISRAAA